MKKMIALVCIGLFVTIVMNSCTIPEITAAKVYINQKNYDKALEQATKATQIAPNNAQAWFVLGESYHYKKMHHEMKDAYEKSLEISNVYKTEINNRLNNDYADLFNRGVQKVNNAEYEKALELFKTASFLMPKRAEAYQNIAFTYMQLAKDSVALEYYAKALNINPEDSTTYKVIGIIHYQNARYEKCIEMMNKVMELTSPNGELFGEAIKHIALSYDLMGESEKAMEIYMQAIEKNPQEAPNLWFNLGSIYLKKSENADKDSPEKQEFLKKAVECYEKVLETSPDDFEANFNIGLALIQLKQFEKAVKKFQKCVDLKPESYAAHYNLAIAAVNAGDAELGQKEFDRADELKPAE